MMYHLSNHIHSRAERRQHEETYGRILLRSHRQSRHWTIFLRSHSRVLEGDILRIEEEFCPVHDTAGHEVRLHVDKSTRLEGGTFKVGDKVEAYTTENGHARYLYHISHLQPAP